VSAGVSRVVYTCGFVVIGVQLQSQAKYALLDSSEHGLVISACSRQLWAGGVEVVLCQVGTDIKACSKVKS
jgi:hypothetical protein